ncbi:MAG: DNA primase [Richelia sp. SM2_1_7]|nr:DNA primase [Richelia sp. SM2_1_7]
MNDYYGAAEGQAIAERWSPSIKGTTWNVGAKFRSFRGRNGISIGTLFHIAKQYGFKFPVPEKKFKRERSNEQRDLEIIEATSARLDKFRKKISNTLINPIRHITPKVKRYVKKPKAINYVPGQLPTPEEWEKQGKPKIQFENASERKQLLQEATSKGYKHALDNSHPGLGKSYSAGELTPCDLGVDKLIYQDINHRNPSTITVEDNFVDIPVRNNGYRIDTTRSTPSGQHYRVRTKPGELPDTEGNCHRTYLFDAFRSKNYSDTFDFEESTVSPICEGCPLENQCRFSSGNGYGFRFQKRTVIENSTKLRSHPDTSPVKIYKSNTDEGKKESYRVARVWEEAGVSIKGVDSVEVTLKDFDHTVSEVALKTPETFEVLKPLFEVLRKLLNKEIKPKSKYGLSNKELVELTKERYAQDGKDLIEELGQLKTGGGLRALQAILRPSLEFLAEKDGIDFNSKEAKDFKSLRWVNRELEKSSAREAGKEFLDLPLFWLVDFIKALISEGSIRYERCKLSIYKHNTKHCELASNAEFNLYLDATLTPEILRLKLGIEEPILVVQQAPPEYTNLKIVQVAGLGKLGKQRSDSLTKRVEALKSQLKNNHPDLKGLEWKALSGDGEFNHFADGRGVNRFEDTSALASFGIPYQNIGELAAHYQVLSEAQIALNNPNDDFQLYVEQLTQAEIVQEIGRLRANRRPDEELTFYFCADYDLSFLAEHFSGATLIKVDAFAITPNAGTENQQNKLAILKAAKELVNRGAKLTQQTIANTAEITQGTISKIASQFGGWSPLKKLFPTLLDSLYSDWNNFNGAKNVDEERECIPELAAYLPTLASAEVSTLEAIEAMVEVLEVTGETIFRQLLKHLDVAVRGKLLGKILPIDCVEAQIILELSPK